MSTETRRVDIRELGERASALIREVHESGDEILLVDGDEEMVIVKPCAISQTGIEEQERAAWARIDEVAARVTKNWTSSLDAVEAVREQRR